jgi:hypothetical protein
MGKGPGLEFVRWAMVQLTKETGPPTSQTDRGEWNTAMGTFTMGSGAMGRLMGTGCFRSLATLLTRGISNLISSAERGRSILRMDRGMLAIFTWVSKTVPGVSSGLTGINTPATSPMATFMASASTHGRTAEPTTGNGTITS